MKSAVAVVIGLITGFVAGIVLSEIIGVAGFVLTRRGVGIKYLPIYLAIAFAVAAPLVRTRIRRGRR
jgi:multisubunit Na+/H+ antiporter MnhE subunit